VIEATTEEMELAVERDADTDDAADDREEASDAEELSELAELPKKRIS